MGRLSRCPLVGCGGGLVAEKIGSNVLVTCSDLDCRFHELHGPAGLIDQAAESQQHQNFRKQARSTHRNLTVRTESQPMTADTENNNAKPVADEVLKVVVCAARGCVRDADGGRGLCTMHYARWGQCDKPDMDMWLNAGAPPAKSWQQVNQPDDLLDQEDVKLAAVNAEAIQADLLFEQQRVIKSVESQYWSPPPIHQPDDHDKVEAAMCCATPTPKKGARWQFPASSVWKASADSEPAPAPPLPRPARCRATLTVAGQPVTFEADDTDSLIELTLSLQRRLMAEAVLQSRKE